MVAFLAVAHGVVLHLGAGRMLIRKSTSRAIETLLPESLSWKIGYSVQFSAVSNQSLLRFATPILISQSATRIVIPRDASCPSSKDAIGNREWDNDTSEWTAISVGFEGERRRKRVQNRRFEGVAREPIKYASFKNRNRGKSMSDWFSLKREGTRTKTASRVLE